jgi:predicted DNA binding CopG/RHH family protein
METKNMQDDAATETKRVVIYIQTELHRALKIRCADEGMKMQDVMRKLIKNYMKGYKGPAA